MRAVLFARAESGTAARVAWHATAQRVAKELGENMTEEELQDMIDQADRDGDGEINPDEFYRIMKKRGDNPLDDLLDDDDD